MMAAVKGCRIAAEEVTGHQHLERAFFPVRRRFHALDRAFFDNMEILGRIAFTKDQVVFSVPGF
jgi:hypothetical protein